MKNVSDIDWSTVSLPDGLTSDEVLRQYKEKMKDLALLDKLYTRHFSGKMKRASMAMMVPSIFDAVQLHVHFIKEHENAGYIDVKPLLAFVASSDRRLFADIAKFTYEFFADKPMGTRQLNIFRSMFVYFLCRAGF